MRYLKDSYILMESDECKRNFEPEGLFLILVVHLLELKEKIIHLFMLKMLSWVVVYVIVIFGLIMRKRRMWILL